jgi:hypothetical protein
MTIAELALNLRKQGSKYWIIGYSQRDKGRNGRAIVSYPYQDTAEPTTEEAVSELENAMSKLADGKYHVRHFADERHLRRGGFETIIQIGSGFAGTTTRPAHVGGAASGSSYANMGVIGDLGGLPAILGEKIELAFLRKEKIELEAELEEYRAQEADPSGTKGLIGMITESIGSIPNGKEIIGAALVNLLGRFLSPGMGITRDTAGAPMPPHTPQNTEHNTMTINQEFLTANNDRICLVLTRLQALDPDILTTLEKMATKGEQNPQTITMLKTFL